MNRFRPELVFQTDIGKIRITLDPKPELLEFNLRGQHANPREVKARIERNKQSHLMTELLIRLQEIFVDGDYTNVASRRVRGRPALTQTDDERSELAHKLEVEMFEVFVELMDKEQRVTQDEMAKHLKIRGERGLQKRMLKLEMGTWTLFLKRAHWRYKFRDFWGI